MKNKFHVVSLLMFIVALLSQTTSMFATSKHTNWITSNQLNHFVTIGVSAGYSTLLENYEDLNTMGAVGGTFGLGYELRVNKFLVLTGIETQYVTASDIFVVEPFTQKIIDTQGKYATMHYRFETIQEAHRLLYLSIPLMCGAYHRGFYCGIGARVGLPVSPITDMNVTYETFGSYGEYIEDFENMDNNRYGQYSCTKKYIHEKLPIRASVLAEMGYDVLSSMRRKDDTQRNGLRIGVTCDYGLNNIVNTLEPTNSIIINKNNANDLTVLPFYQSHAITGRRVNNLYVGLKLTWIFDFSKEPCDCDE